MFCVVGLALTCQFLTAEVNGESPLMSDIEPKFSFLNPDSYHFADEHQKSILKDIYRTEFDLSHLPIEDQELLTEALGKSGVEVQSTCKVHKETTGQLRAFFRKHDEHAKVNYFPAESGKPASMQVYEAEGSPHITQNQEYQPIVGDTADYPYPLSEANVVIKLIPINLSSIEVTQRTDSVAVFKAYPSKILYAKLREEDQLWDLVDTKIEFEVDLARKRLNWLDFALQKPVKAYHFVRVSAFRLRYEFEDNEVVNRNVVKSVEHHMKGRLALVFQPNFDFTNVLTYESCVAPPPTESYLTRAMDSIANL